MNPYRHAITKMTALLKTEAKLSPEERAQNQWQFLVRFSDTQLMVGKGDVNTMFYQLGAEGKRHVVYPDVALEKLEILAKQKYWRYKAVINGTTTYFWTLKSLLRDVAPQKSACIYGIDETETLIGSAVPSFGGVTWRMKESIDGTAKTK